jgi:membrane protease YdiL (CAAX protease family)
MVAVLGAFAAGIVLYVSLQTSNSILVPIMIHGGYNAIVQVMGASLV